MIIFLLLSACATPCPLGPGCEDDFGASRLAIHLAPGATSAAFEDADWVVEGTDAEGTEWEVLAIGNELLIGMPGANRVDRYAFEDGAMSYVDSWGADSGSFGARLEQGDFDDNGLWDLVVSAPDAELQAGRVYVFLDAERNGGLPAADADLLVRGGTSADRFGTQLAVCEDFDGAPGAELVVTAPWYGTTQITGFGTREIPLQGAVYVASGLSAESGPEVAAQLAWHGAEAGDTLGRSLSCDADFNRDGASDLVIGAPFAGSTDLGRVYIVAGGRGPVTGGPITDLAHQTEDGLQLVELKGRFVNAWCGMSALPIEINGDDSPDVAVGCPGADNGQGEVLLFTSVQMALRPDGPKYSGFLAAADVPSQVLQVHVGRQLASGDVDGDGLSDLIVGAPDFRSGVTRTGYDQGRAWVYLGRNRANWQISQTSAESADFSFTATSPFQRLGRTLGVADLDGDGRDDLLLPLRKPSSF